MKSRPFQVRPILRRPVTVKVIKHINYFFAEVLIESFHGGYRLSIIIQTPRAAIRRSIPYIHRDLQLVAFL
jgi:hypothetical protein